MQNNFTSISPATGEVYPAIFNAFPGNGILLKNDAPRYTILSVTAQYLNVIGLKKEAITGKSFPEVFPIIYMNAGESAKDGMLASFAQVLQNKTANHFSFQAEIKNEEGELVKKNWNVQNKPVITNNDDADFIIHSVEEIINNQIDTPKKELSNNESAYHFFMNAPVIIGLLKGDDYNIEMANEGLLSVWGRTPEVIGKPLLQAIPELEEQGFISLLENVRQTGVPYYAYEYPITLNRNGNEEVLYFDFVYKPFYENETGKKASGVISVGHDVTTQVLAKKKLEESESKYRSLFDSMDQGFCVIEMLFDDQSKPYDYRFVETNPVFETLTGLTNAIGKTARELLPDLESHWFDIYGKVALTGKSIRFTEGSEVMGRWFDVNAFRLGNENSNKVALLFTNITDQKNSERQVRESEQRFRKLADESPMFVFMIDANPDAPVEYWNKTWLQYTGQSMEEAKGRAWDGILHPDDVPVVMSYYTPAFQNQTSYFIPAIRVKRFDGEFRWHAFKGNPRYLPNGDFNGYMGVGFDIHEQKLAEEGLKLSEIQLQQKVAERTRELERTVEELSRSNTNLQEFAYAASHDLKEPIRKIHFFGDRIRESMKERMTDVESKYFERMEAASVRMGSLIDDLLSYSQISIRPKTFEEVNMNQLIDLVLEDLDLEIEDKGAVINVEKLFTLQGHHRQLQQAFQNLISNALKYNQPGKSPVVNIHFDKVLGKQTALSLTADDQEKSFYLVHIKDNGIGFEQADAERIFNVFTRLHGLAEYRGTGIGLSIVRKVIENHHGYTWAESQPGQGSSFKVLLPAD